MFDKILVGYEGSERSEDALALALALVGSSGAVTAAFSYWWQPLSSRVDGGGPGQSTMRAGAEATLAPLEHRPGPPIDTVAAFGPSPQRALRDLATEGQFDLVVVGSTHRGAAGRVLAGTTADALLQGATCPVAVAPLGYRRRVGAIRDIGVAFDGREPSRAALSTGHAIAADCEAGLVVLRCFTGVPALVAGGMGYGGVPDEPQLRSAAEAELDKAVADLGDAVPVRGELLDGLAGLRLAERSAELDLLVVGSKGHHALGRLLLGSVSQYLMCHAAAPVLVVPPAR